MENAPAASRRMNPIVEAAMRERGTRVDRQGVLTAKGMRVEFSAGDLKVATIDLGDGVRIGVAGDECWTDMIGTLPGQMTMTLPGMPIETVVRHRWTDGSGMVVSAVEPRGDRTRIHLVRS